MAARLTLIVLAALVSLAGCVDGYVMRDSNGHVISGQTTRYAPGYRMTDITCGSRREIIGTDRNGQAKFLELQCNDGGLYSVPYATAIGWQSGGAYMVPNGFNLGMYRSMPPVQRVDWGNGYVQQTPVAPWMYDSRGPNGLNRFIPQETIKPNEGGCGYRYIWHPETNTYTTEPLRPL